MPEIPGIAIAALVLLVIVVILMALALVKINKPASVTGQFVTGVESRLASFDDAVHAEATKLHEQWKAAEPALQRFGQAVKSEAESMLEAVEKKLTDVASEDAKIAEHEAGILAQKASKEFKRALLSTHIEKMQAHLATLPTAGS